MKYLSSTHGISQDQCGSVLQNLTLPNFPNKAKQNMLSSENHFLLMNLFPLIFCNRKSLLFNSFKRGSPKHRPDSYQDNFLYHPHFRASVMPWAHCKIYTIHCNVENMRELDNSIFNYMCPGLSFSLHLTQR